MEVNNELKQLLLSKYPELIDLDDNLWLSCLDPWSNIDIPVIIIDLKNLGDDIYHIDMMVPREDAPTNEALWDLENNLALYDSTFDIDEEGLIRLLDVAYPILCKIKKVFENRDIVEEVEQLNDLGFYETNYFRHIYESKSIAGDVCVKIALGGLNEERLILPYVRIYPVENKRIIPKKGIILPGLSLDELLDKFVKG